MNKATNLIGNSNSSFPGSQNAMSAYFLGAIDYQVISNILMEVEEKLSSLNSSSDMKKKILGITTELLQNILHHCRVKVIGNQSFLFEKKVNQFMLTVSNPIYKSEIEALKNRIETLNAYTAEELKQQYQNVLRNGDLVGENAGLGLMDILRKSGKPILAKFAPIDNKYSLFTVTVFVKI